MSKPLVVFDIETTGLDKKKDYIIQFSAVKYDRDKSIITDSINHYIQPSGNYSISIVAFLKHKITPDFLKDKPLFIDVAQDIFNFFEGCDILTYNGIGFDAPFLKREFNDCGIEWNFSDYTFFDAFKEELRRNNNQLSSTFERYTGKTMEDAGYVAHDAMSDVKATLDVFLNQQRIKPYDPEKILTDDGFIRIHEFADVECECFSTGKWKDVSVEYVAKYDKSYINWVISSPDFDKNTKLICEKYLS